LERILDVVRVRVSVTRLASNQGRPLILNLDLNFLEFKLPPFCYHNGEKQDKERESKVKGSFRFSYLFLQLIVGRCPLGFKKPSELRAFFMCACHGASTDLPVQQKRSRE